MAEEQAGHSEGASILPAGPQASPDIVQIARELEDWYDLAGRQFGPLSRPQRRMLRLIADRAAAGQPPRVSDLAARLGLTAAGATRMLDTLSTLGFVTRYRRPESDQRQVHVALTSTGQQALDEADCVYLARVSAAASQLSPSERDTLATLLAKLIAAGRGAPPSPNPDSIT